MKNIWRLMAPGLALILLTGMASAQSGSLTGVVEDDNTEQKLPGLDVILEGTVHQTTTSTRGRFLLENIEPGSYHLVISSRENHIYEQAIEIAEGEVLDLGTINVDVRIDDLDFRRELPVIELDESDFESSDIEVQDYSQMLSASRDLFQARAGFAFGQRRFRVRGYDAQYSTMMLNGIPMNDLESGNIIWAHWGGLNDVLRSRTSSVGLEPTEFAFTDIGGGTSIDTRALQQWQQTRIGYAASNRSYNHRVMATHSTGLMPGEWALSVSASRRWAQEGFQEGTFYDAWSYFISADKLFGDGHSINLTFFGAQSKRGRSGPATQEAYDLSGDNHYNSFWGFQDGEKRNSRVARSHRPTVILRHDWEIINQTNITTAISFQKGMYGTTALDWNNARDPRPDYYRYMPSYANDPGLADAIAERWKNEPEVRQLNWDDFYFVNRRSQTTIKDVDGIEGNNVTGNRSKYIVEQRRFDPTVLSFNSTINSVISPTVKLIGGIGYQRLTNESYKKVNDLLGGDFHLDIDRFAERDVAALGQLRLQSDLQNPNRIVTEGDVFGYHYDINVEKANAWAQTEFDLRRFYFFAGAQLTYTNFWRTGYMQNGHFPDNSLGDSEKTDFTNYSTKAGATFKISGRQYLYGNVSYQTRAPQARHSFLSPRTSHRLNPKMTEETIMSLEGGYQIRTPFVRGRLTGYYTEFSDITELIAFYNDIERAFGFYFLEDVNTTHQGIEAAVEVKVSPTLSVSGVAALGFYRHTSNPRASQVQDRTEEFLFEDETIYTKGFLVSGTPQTALSLGFSYNSPNYWFINMDVNYFDDLYIDFNPDRRRAVAFDLVEKGSEQWERIHRQESTESAVMVNVFGGKSWRIERGKFIYLNVGINNLLNTKDIRTGGFEQRRYNFQDRDPDTHPSRYFYAQGINFFASLAYRF